MIFKVPSTISWFYEVLHSYKKDQKKKTPKQPNRSPLKPFSLKVKQKSGQEGPWLNCRAEQGSSAWSAEFLEAAAPSALSGQQQLLGPSTCALLRSKMLLPNFAHCGRPWAPHPPACGAPTGCGCPTGWHILVPPSPVAEGSPQAARSSFSQLTSFTLGCCSV